MRHRSFAQEQIMPTGAETKNRTFMQWLAAQRAGLVLPCRATERPAKDIADPLAKFSFASGLRPARGNLSVADTTTSFSLKSSLPPSWWLPSRSSLPSSLSWPCRPL